LTFYFKLYCNYSKEDYYVLCGFIYG